MSNLELTRFDKDGIELLIDTKTGESFASVSGYVRMSGKTQPTISRRLKGIHEGEVKASQIETEGGLQGHTLISEKLICKWLPKDNPEMASQLMQLGVRVFLHQLAGYEVKSTAVAPAGQITLAPETGAKLTAIHEETRTLREENRIIIAMLQKFGDAVETASTAIAGKSQEKMEVYYGKKAEEFERIRQRNELERYVRKRNAEDPYRQY